MGMDDEARDVGGRPTIYSDALAARVATHIRGGVPLEHAAWAEGLPSTTAFRWMEEGATGKEPYARFYAQVKEAEGKCVVELTGEIKGAQKAPKGEAEPLWTPKAWLLERRWPKHYGRTQVEVEHTGMVATVAIEGLDKLGADGLSTLIEKAESALANRRK